MLKKIASLENKIAELELDNNLLRAKLRTNGTTASSKHPLDELFRNSPTERILALLTSKAGFVGVWDWDVSTGILRFSPSFCHLLGYAENELEPSFSSIMSILHPEDAPSAMRALHNHMQHNEPYVEEARLRTKTLEWRWILTQGFIPLRDGKGRPLRMIGFNFDVHERKLQELANLRLAERCQAILERAPTGVAVYEPIDNGRDFIFRGFNAMAESISKISRDKVLGRKLLDAFPNMDRFGLPAALQKAWLEGKPQELPPAYYRDQNREGWRKNSIHRLPTGELVAFYQDVSLEIETETLLEKSETLTQGIFEASPEVIIVMNTSGHILRCSAEGVRLLELQSDRDILGTHFVHWLHPDERDTGVREFNRLLLAPDSPPVTNTLRLLKKNGESFHGAILSRVLQNTEGEPRAMLSMIRDVSQEIEMESKLLEAKAQAEAASRSKSEFLANASHDIRTPLNGLLGMLQLLQLTSLDDEQSQYVETAITAGKALLHVVSDILDLSRVEAGRLEIQQTAYTLTDCLRDIIALFKPQTANKGLELHLDIDPQLPETVVGDSSRLWQILFNLLGNALKYTDKGYIRFAAHGLPNQWSDDSFRLLIVIEDSGPGMPTDQLAAAFEPFTQLVSTSKRAPGAGLGLAIVKRLVRLMDGSLWVDSAPGEGTAVILQFPMRLACLLATREATETPPEPVRQRGRILVAEDDAVSRSAMLLLLERLGYEAVAATDGPSALRIIQNRRFDAVLMDIEMPGVDGVETARRLRRLETSAGRVPPPIIVVSAHALTEHREHYLNVERMDGYLAKPVEMDELRDLLAHFLGPGRPLGT